jgi:hypothetical protein
MSADISALGGLQPVEPLDLENYADNKESNFQLPVKGRYTLRARESFPQAAFGETKAGNLSISVDPTIVGPSNEGFNIRFTKVSAKQFKRGAGVASQAGDYLRACGIRTRLTSNQDIADACERTASALFEADLDWRAYNKNTGFSVEGMERFPSDGQGGHLSYFLDPNEKDENGNPVKLRANLFVNRYVPAV